MQKIKMMMRPLYDEDEDNVWFELLRSKTRSVHPP